MVLMNEIDKVLESVKTEIVNFLSDKGVLSPEINLERSSNQKFGDYSSNVAMKYAKDLKMSPEDLAQDLVSSLETKGILNIEKIDFIKPGFINFFFDKELYKNYLLNILNSDSDFGKNQDLINQKWVVEHTSPNPNKAMHLGHLRNNLVGMGIVRILKWNGAEVVSDAVYNNRGIAIAKLMWGFLVYMKKEHSLPTDVSFWSQNKDQWFNPEEKRMKPDVFVTQCYILGENDFKENPEAEDKIRDLVVKWEAKDKEVWELWEYVLDFAYEGIDKTLDRLGSHWDKIWFEHEHYQEGKDFITKGLEEGIFKKLDDGAVLTNLSSYNIPDTILLKKDGTSLYITQDTALTSLKKNYYKADKLIWVIGPEQSLAMRQLFAVCEQLGIGKIEDFTHVPYGYVGLKALDGGFKKMSSREGTVVLIDDLIDEVKNKIIQKLIDENKEENKDLDILSEKLALAAIKFSILKSDRSQDLTFDIEQSIDLTGDSGVYALYTYVRIQSILRKVARTKTQKVFVMPEKFGSEETIIRELIFFPEIIKRSKDELSVHYIAQYLLQICSAFNSWYAEEVILDNSENQDYKVAVAGAVGVVIKNGLEILGIETVESM